jgi:hypothetical protein
MRIRQLGVVEQRDRRDRLELIEDSGLQRLRAPRIGMSRTTTAPMSSVAVQQELPARAQHPGDLIKNLVGVLGVIQDVPTVREVKAAIVKREFLRAGWVERLEVIPSERLHLSINVEKRIDRANGGAMDE